MMIASDKSAYRGTLCALLVIFVMVLVAGFIGDQIGSEHRDFEKAEGLIADLDAIAREVPRLPDGSIVRQGLLPSAWLDDVAALPARLAAMAGTLKGAEHERALGLVLRGPWSFTVPVEAKDSLIWTKLEPLSQVACEQFQRAAAGHPEQVAYVNSTGDPPLLLGALGPTWLCRMNFNSLTLITLDPPTEVRRLSADIQNAVKTMPANLTDKMPISGTSAPFQVYRGQDGGPGFVERDQSGIRVTINNVPLAVCRLALLVGPKGFGMDAFEASDGKTVSLRTRSVSETVCNNLKGRLILTRY
jgi:hypothetical protein